MKNFQKVTIDEALFTFVASYLRRNPKIDTFALCGRSIGQFNHLKMLMENPSQDDRNEKMEQEIHNMQHIFNLYQVLIKKDNLIELRLILFLNRYNFCMLGLVLQNNTNLKILEVRNMINKDREKDLDYTFKEMNEFGDNIRDEIFIFFNYLFAEDNITELSLTHFNFFSEINFMAAQAAKTMKNLQILNLESNVGLVNNDDVMANAYNLSFLPMVKLNMGMTYFRMIRNWDSLINPFNLQFLDAGVCDFTSFCSCGDGLLLNLCLDGDLFAGIVRHIELSFAEGSLFRLDGDDCTFIILVIIFGFACILINGRSEGMLFTVFADDVNLTDFFEFAV